MKIIIVCLLLTIFVCIGSSIPIDPKRILVNRPKIKTIFKRSLPHYEIMGVKGYRPGRKAMGATPPPPRKGEYICGNKICKLKPNEVPKGCEDGLCQYPIN